MDNTSGDPRMYVRTIYTKIILNNGLNEAMTLGFNHIPLRNTNISEIVQVVVDTFRHVCQLLKVDELIDVDMASKMVCPKSRDKLVSAMREYLFGFKYSKPFIFSEKAVENNYLDFHY